MERRIISIHSEDKDMMKWENNHEFEIRLPEPLYNIRSLQIRHALFPSELVFSHQYMNTMIRIDTNFVNNNFNSDFSSNYILINDGEFTGNEMAIEIQNALRRKNIYSIRVFHERPYNKFSFIDICNNIFRMRFDINNERFMQKYIESQSNDNSTPVYKCDFFNRHLNIFENKINWGMGYYLGFRHKHGLYESNTLPFGDTLQSIPRHVIQNSSSFTTIFQNLEIEVFSDASNVQMVQSEYPAKLNGDKIIYMEMDPYNYIDEIDPNNANTNNAYNNQSNYRVNSAFSKILLQVNDNNSSSDAFLGKEKRFEPPLPRLASCKFRFRYHDGRLVEFRDQDFSFSLKIDYMPILRR